MSKTPNVQEGGIRVGGNLYAGKVAGRDLVEQNVTEKLSIDLDALFAPIVQEVGLAPPAVELEAKRQVGDLEKELKKEDKADDGVIARLIKGLVGLVPAAVSALVATFANPIALRTPMPRCDGWIGLSPIGRRFAPLLNELLATDIGPATSSQVFGLCLRILTQQKAMSTSTVSSPTFCR
jgi:hypothetical protein